MNIWNAFLKSSVLNFDANMYTALFNVSNIENSLAVIIKGWCSQWHMLDGTDKLQLCNGVLIQQ